MFKKGSQSGHFQKGFEFSAKIRFYTILNLKIAENKNLRLRSN
ncbi:Hypothetical protein Ccan_19220 [Capnocytophaga canimorsus Cc5]|uniref:Uncharacterized protein n=1 Tax=Capnocytophaga canimorsus (strain 5) TaxID=860228 RepID=F9YTB9_CAPCC|nr:Hypothetical protein Ccan_19220 [Capnocytophaga canimorsus Cc5]